MKTWAGVWIVLRDGFWFVGIQRGYYNQPLDKAAAIKRARELRRKGAETSGRSPAPINVFGDDDRLIEQIV